MFEGFSKVRYYSNLGSVARANFKTGELMLCAESFDQLDSDVKKFIVYHELGHVRLRTKNEFTADRYAIRRMHNKGLPYSAAIKAMKKSLNLNLPYHQRRIKEVKTWITRFELQNQTKKNISPMNKSTPLIFHPSRRNPTIPTAADYEADFGINLGLTKKGRERIRANKAAKHERKLERIAARGTARAGVAAAGGNNALNTIFGGLGGLFGGGGTTTTDPADSDPKDNDPNNNPKDNTILYVTIGLLVLVVGIYLVKKRGK